MHLPLEPEICIIGAGFAGLCAAVKLKEAGFLKFTVFESNEEVGGTWLVNKYPGCACDVPSHLYSFSFAPKSDWSKHYSSQPEILGYLKGVAHQYSLYPHIRFSTQVECLRWNVSSFKWIATINSIPTGKKETKYYDIVVTATGMLRIPNIPEDFRVFKGHLLHSAKWDTSIDLSGKRVGIIGAGASAIQIVPAIVNKVKTLTVFQRRAPYIMPKLQFDYPEAVTWALNKIPGMRWVARTTIFWMQEFLYLGFRHNTYGSKIAEIFSDFYRRSQIFRNSNLRWKTTPNYKFGCKRILPSNDYYAALLRPNVDVITRKIVSVEGSGIETDDGSITELDVLILATGFKVHDYFAPLFIAGKDEENVLHSWMTVGPRTYLGILSSSMPNCFTLLGPHTGLGHSSVVFMIECQVNWMIKVLLEMKVRKVSYVCVRKEAEAAFMEWYDEGHKLTVWGNSNCESWYKSPNGRIDTLYPSNLVSFWNLTSSLDAGALEFR